MAGRINGWWVGWIGGGWDGWEAGGLEVGVKVGSWVVEIDGRYVGWMEGWQREKK